MEKQGFVSKGSVQPHSDLGKDELSSARNVDRKSSRRTVKTCSSSAKSDSMNLNQRFFEPFNWGPLSSSIPIVFTIRIGTIHI